MESVPLYIYILIDVTFVQAAAVIMFNAFLGHFMVHCSVHLLQQTV